ncbi:MAG: FHA domain-containing protein [Leptospiraceae bacterium]|nr:FHA domain-containing protein [Leptospiraceae bacterium]MDW7977022.1 FHA domain-containing protein [Leptospiraceae bacterium]
MKRFFFSLLLVSRLFAQSQEIQDIKTHPEVINYRFGKGFPDFVLELEFSEDTHYPVNLQKEQIWIQEIYSQQESTFHPKRIEVLDTYTKENNQQTKEKKVFSVLLDATKSLSRKDFETLKETVRDFIENNPKHVISLYKIQGGAKSVQNFTSNNKRLLEKLEKIERTGKQTKLYDAIYKVLLDTQKYVNKNQRSVGGIFVFTDGKEETSILEPKDIEELIIHGTKFGIPIYFIFSHAKYSDIWVKISSKTGGETFFVKDFSPREVFSSEVPENGNAFLSLRKIKLEYTSSLPVWEYFLAPAISTKILINTDQTKPKETLIEYRYPLPMWYRLVLYGVLAFLVVILSWFYFYYRKRKKMEEKDTSKMEFPEPEITNDIFIDLRRYKDEPKKKYQESEERPDIPLLAQAWLEPSYAPYLDDPKERKKFSYETMTLNLKEKSYMVLQAAVKEAPAYSHGALMKKEPGMDREKKFDLFLEEVYIGSSTAAHIPVRDPAVSPIHAKIKKIENKFILFDLMSVAGTYLNGKKVLRPMPLKHNDVIRIGHTIFRFVGED